MDELGKDGGVGGHRHTLADRAPPPATMQRLLHKVFHVKPEGGGVSMSRRPSIVDSDGDYPVKIIKLGADTTQGGNFVTPGFQ